MVTGMEFSEIVKLKIKDSESYNSMVVCDLISRIKQEDPKPKEHCKKVKNAIKRKQFK